MIDCNQLPGHLRAICTGDHRKSDGQPYNDYDRAEIIGRFLRTSIDPDDLPVPTLTPQSRLTSKSQVGTRLHQIIEREAGVKIECSECRDEVTRLNILTVAQVRLQREAIAEGIVGRGKVKAPKFWQRWGARLAPGMAKQQALAWIDEACDSEVQPIKPPAYRTRPMPAVVPAENVVGCVHDGKVKEFKTLLEERSVTKWKFGNVDHNNIRRVIDISGSPEYLIEVLKIVNDGHERPQYDTPYVPQSWQYAVTSVLARLDSTLPETLSSLASSGFDTPIISIDGPDNPVWHTKLSGDFIFRGENIRSYAHWYLTLQELYFRNPYAQYYAIFQDDFVCVPNLKTYLESCEYPEKGYWNLFTFMENDVMVSQVSQKGWMPAARAVQGHQLGRGAVALVFSQEAVIKLLSSRYMQTRIMDAVKGHRSIDGAVVSAMHLEGWTEYVHNPSLVQHTGEVSSMGNRKHPISKCYIDGYDPLAIP